MDEYDIRIVALKAALDVERNVDADRVLDTAKLFEEYIIGSSATSPADAKECKHEFVVTAAGTRDCLMCGVKTDAY